MDTPTNQTLQDLARRAGNADERVADQDRAAAEAVVPPVVQPPAPGETPAVQPPAPGETPAGVPPAGVPPTDAERKQTIDSYIDGATTITEKGANFILAYLYVRTNQDSGRYGEALTVTPSGTTPPGTTPTVVPTINDATHKVTNLKEGDFELLPEGNYDVDVVSNRLSAILVNLNSQTSNPDVQNFAKYLLTSKTLSTAQLTVDIKHLYKALSGKVISNINITDTPIRAGGHNQSIVPTTSLSKDPSKSMDTIRKMIGTIMSQKPGRTKRKRAGKYGRRKYQTQKRYIF